MNTPVIQNATRGRMASLGHQQLSLQNEGGSSTVLGIKDFLAD
jgi:hypothetical protein